MQTERVAMKPEEMERLIKEHLDAEFAGDDAGCIAMYTDDVVHDVVGWPEGPMHGKAEAQRFYQFLIQNIKSEEMTPVHTYYGDNHTVIEHLWTGTVPGEFLGVPGHGKRISFRMLHVWEFRDGKMCRENVWLDGGSIIAQLTSV
jgi:steroid delta-isomerase-like uncharacterized protein